MEADPLACAIKHLVRPWYVRSGRSPLSRPQQLLVCWRRCNTASTPTRPRRWWWQQSTRVCCRLDKTRRAQLQQRSAAGLHPLRSSTTSTAPTHRTPTPLNSPPHSPKDWSRVSVHACKPRQLLHRFGHPGPPGREAALGEQDPGRRGQARAPRPEQPRRMDHRLVGGVVILSHYTTFPLYQSVKGTVDDMKDIFKASQKAWPFEWIDRYSGPWFSHSLTVPPKVFTHLPLPLFPPNEVSLCP